MNRIRKPDSSDLLKQSYFDENFYYSDDEYDLNENELTDSDFLNDPATPKLTRTQSRDITNNAQNAQEENHNELLRTVSSFVIIYNVMDGK